MLFILIFAHLFAPNSLATTFGEELRGANRLSPAAYVEWVKTVSMRDCKTILSIDLEILDRRRAELVSSRRSRLEAAVFDLQLLVAKRQYECKRK